MNTSAAFGFVTTAPERADVTLDASIRGERELLTRIAESLLFPDYFGYNWDALVDCLSDLSWWSTGEVVIDHIALPGLPPEEVGQYLKSLLHVAQRLESRAAPTVRFTFRAKDRERVLTALLS